MTVILVLTLFLAFITLDFILNRRKATQPAVAPSRARPLGALLRYVEGFLTPEHLRYHPGHTWLARERKNLVRVGVDEFAAVLAGPLEKIELPKPGHWVRQGQKALAFTRDAERAEMVSPIEGEVIEVNPEVPKNPSLLRQDPYGRGWLMTVFVPDEENTARNLVPEGLVAGWMRDAVERLYTRMPQLAGAVAADGGRPTDDVFAALPETSWHDLTREFFLT